MDTTRSFSLRSTPDKLVCSSRSNANKTVVYLLTLENGKYYVGITFRARYSTRMYEHEHALVGYTRTNPVISHEILCEVDSRCTLLERTYTLYAMEKFGVNNVRGSIWCKNLGLADYQQILQDYIDQNELCRYCRGQAFYLCSRLGHTFQPCRFVQELTDYIDTYSHRSTPNYVISSGTPEQSGDDVYSDSMHTFKMLSDAQDLDDIELPAPEVNELELQSLRMANTYMAQVIEQSKVDIADGDDAIRRLREENRRLRCTVAEKDSELQTLRRQNEQLSRNILIKTSEMQILQALSGQNVLHTAERDGELRVLREQNEQLKRDNIVKHSEIQTLHRQNAHLRCVTMKNDIERQVLHEQDEHPVRDVDAAKTVPVTRNSQTQPISGLMSACIWGSIVCTTLILSYCNYALIG